MACFQAASGGRQGAGGGRLKRVRLFPGAEDWPRPYRAMALAVAASFF